MEVDVLSRKGRGKGKSGKGKKGGKKGKESHSGKGYGESKVEHTRFDGDCRNFGKHGHKAADCWYKKQHKSQGKGKGAGKSKSNVTEISENDTLILQEKVKVLEKLITGQKQQIKELNKALDSERSTNTEETKRMRD